MREWISNGNIYFALLIPLVGLALATIHEKIKVTRKDWLIVVAAIPVSIAFGLLVPAEHGTHLPPAFFVLALVIYWREWSASPGNIPVAKVAALTWLVLLVADILLPVPALRAAPIWAWPGASIQFVGGSRWLDALILIPGLIYVSLSGLRFAFNSDSARPDQLSGDPSGASNL